MRCSPPAGTSMTIIFRRSKAGGGSSHRAVHVTSAYSVKECHSEIAGVWSFLRVTLWNCTAVSDWSDFGLSVTVFGGQLAPRL